MSSSISVNMDDKLVKVKLLKAKLSVKMEDKLIKFNLSKWKTSWASSNSLSNERQACQVQSQ